MISEIAVPLLTCRVQVPGGASGRLPAAVKGGAPISGYYRFSAKANQQWVIETQAARRGTPVDTRIQVLWPDGSPRESFPGRGVDQLMVLRKGEGNK